MLYQIIRNVYQTLQSSWQDRSFYYASEQANYQQEQTLTAYRVNCETLTNGWY